MPRASVRCGRVAPCLSARLSRCVSAAATRRARAIRSTRAGRPADRRAGRRPRSRRGCCRWHSAPTRAARPSARQVSAAPMHSSPRFGAINRQGSFSMAYSMDHVGVFAGTLSDVWSTARYIASQAGGDPGYPGLDGPLNAPSPRKPVRLIRLGTAGWPVAEPAAKDAFEAYLKRLASAGVAIVSRRDDAAIEAYETALAGMPELWTHLYRYEMHWPM